jgi:hypothetical protein
MFQYVLTLLKADTSPFTIMKHLTVSKWVHVKGRRGKRYDEITCCHAFKAALTEAYLCKLEKNNF